MSKLALDGNRFGDADAAYRMLIDAHRGLSQEDSAALNARLVLILANQVGDLDLLRQALDMAGNRAQGENTGQSGAGASE